MTILSKITALSESLCGYFFAERRCLVCHIPFMSHEEQVYLCEQCAAQIKYNLAHACNLCGHSIPASSNICITCLDNPPKWNTLTFYGSYDGLLKYLILKYKFSADFSLLPLLTNYLYRGCNHLTFCDVIIPMPRHTKRLQSEGFNHILELCRPLSKQLNITLDHKALIRTRYTPPQSTLSAKQREHNPSKSFIAQNIKGKNILLIDDVITTGSTLRHASMALKKAGAKGVYVAVIARVDHLKKSL